MKCLSPLLRGLTYVACACCLLTTQAVQEAPEGVAVTTETSTIGPFVNTAPNWEVSPYTGMDREGWVRCGMHILQGAFTYVDNLEDPMFFPKFPGPGYPQNNETASRQQRSAAIFEAIARSFNIAAPLIKENPDIEINGIRLADYYKHHLLEIMCNPESTYFMGETTDYSSQIQQTCELGNLAMWCVLAPEAFWDLLNEEEKAEVSDVFQAWAGTHTLPHNWRWFNVMMLTFLKVNGYEIDEALMVNHLDHLLLHHAGEGWFRDTGYDYYTAHVFQLYGAVWAAQYGREHEPQRAAMIDQQFEAFADHYPQIFGRDGEVIMYGRSVLYRLGASAGMGASSLRQAPNAHLPAGLARRVASGALLQFVTHPDFFYEGLPSLGFYGPFPSAIQGYSCSASPFWMFLNFSCLTLPENDPFWTDTEEMGHWADIATNEVHTEYWEGPGFLVSNHGQTGTTDLRICKVHNSNPNYSRLIYNSAFPWEAYPNDGICSGTVTLSRKGGKFALPRAVNASGFRDGVLYRQAQYSGHLPPLVDMASIVIPGGEIRVERFRRMHPCQLNIGHFSMPHLNGAVPENVVSEIDGCATQQIRIDGRQLSISAYMGWDGVERVTRAEIHPEAQESTLLYLNHADEGRFSGPRIMISTLLHRADNEPWRDDELQPIASVEPLLKNGVMHLTGLRITLKSNKVFNVDFKNIDGTCSTW